MRHFIALFAALLIAIAGGRAAAAASVYRCVGADGSVGFQDHACRAGQDQRIVRLPAPPPVPVPIAVPADPPVPDPKPAAAPMVAAPAIPAPDFFLCTRHDGSQYPSDDGRGGSSAVPLGMLGVPGRDLAQAYGGRDGIGVSAPGLRAIAQLPAAQAPLANGYIWIDDVCQHASPREACAYLRGELDAVQDQLKRAFSDTEAQLKQQQAALRERMRGC